MLAAPQLEAAREVQVQPLPGGLAALGLQRVGRAVVEPHQAVDVAVARVAVDAAPDVGGLRDPVVVEAVHELGIDLLGGARAAAPVGAEEGLARRIEEAAIGVGAGAVVDAAVVLWLHAARQAQRRARTEVCLDDRIAQRVAARALGAEAVAALGGQQRAAAHRAGFVERTADVDLATVLVPRAGRQQARDRGLGQRPLAHQVHGAGRRARSLQHAGGTAEHLDAVVHREVELAQVLDAVVERQAVVLHLGGIAARLEIGGAVAVGNGRDADGLAQRVLDRGHVLVVHLLARDDRDRIRHVLPRRGRLAGHGHGAGGIGAAAFGERVALAARGHHHGGQAAVARCRGTVGGRLAQAIVAGRDRHRLEAAAGQQAPQALLDALAAFEAGRTQALGQRGIEGQRDAVRAREAVERLAQWPGRDRLAGGRVGALGDGGRQRGGERRGEGDGGEAMARSEGGRHGGSGRQVGEKVLLSDLSNERRKRDTQRHDARAPAALTPVRAPRP